MPASRSLRLPRMLVDRAYMPPPFGRRPGGIASPVSFSAADPRGNGCDVVLLGGTARSQKSGRNRRPHRGTGAAASGDVTAPEPHRFVAHVVDESPDRTHEDDVARRYEKRFSPRPSGTSRPSRADRLL